MPNLNIQINEVMNIQMSQFEYSYVKNIQITQFEYSNQIMNIQITKFVRKVIAKLNEGIKKGDCFSKAWSSFEPHWHWPNSGPSLAQFLNLCQYFTNI